MAIVVLTLSDSEYRIASTSSEAVSELERRTSACLSDLAANLTASLSQMTQGIGSLVSSTRSMNTQLSERFAQLTEMYEVIASRTDEKVGGLTANLDLATGRLGTLIGDLGHLVESLKSQLLAHREVSGHLTQTAQKVAENSASVASFTQQASAVTQALTRTVVPTGVSNRGVRGPLNVRL
ncbi:MAG: hypothetical protein ACYCW6_12730 [Candidatus Xenobia bacterium]